MSDFPGFPPELLIPSRDMARPLVLFDVLQVHSAVATCGDAESVSDVVPGATWHFGPLCDVPVTVLAVAHTALVLLIDMRHLAPEDEHRIHVVAFPYTDDALDYFHLPDGADASGT